MVSDEVKMPKGSKCQGFDGKFKYILEGRKFTIFSFFLEKHNGLMISLKSLPFSSSSRFIRRSNAAVLPMLSCLARERGEILAASAASKYRRQ